jgi:hypothetical protein
VYISVERAYELDKVVKSNEVALRSFIVDVLYSQFDEKSQFESALQSISISNEVIYSRRFTNKISGFISKSDKIYDVIQDIKTALDTKQFNNDVLYVSEIIDLLLVFFNAHFSDKAIASKFQSIEEFHYCCSLYHKIRNDLSHPGSRPTSTQDANKVIYFIENIVNTLDDGYFWFHSKVDIKKSIKKFYDMEAENTLSHSNLEYISSSHKSLLCRDNIIAELYECLLGNEKRKRLAGSIVLYGYGGVGKTAITSEFLYRVDRDKLDGKYSDIDFLLFFSSKDEYLRENKTTGQLYLDSAKPEFTTCEHLVELICKALDVANLSELENIETRGIIAIDNIENIDSSERQKILDLIKSLPRNFQFIVTSRNEESCEEKIHIEEFSYDEIGKSFIAEIIESEGFDVNFSEPQIESILKATKGNALIIVQVLNIINRGVSTFEEIISDLHSMKSKNTEMIANFMYKNTFDSALRYLEGNGFPITTILQIISLYDEKIELYSISKLAKVGVSDTEHVCHYLLERLILKKLGEYYELNEFAKKFVFIKLMPDRFQQANLIDKISTHKSRMNQKLKRLENTTGKNRVLRDIVAEWQPNNYIDKIVIAELFSLYGDAIKHVSNNDFKKFENSLKEFDEHAFITSHPYVPLQKARLLKEALKKFKMDESKVIPQIESLYEESLASIEYDYRNLIGTSPHSSLLMFFGVFLSQQMKQFSRSIRCLEDSLKYKGNEIDNGWFITSNYLSVALQSKYKETNDSAYNDQLRKIYKSVIQNKSKANNTKFNVSTYEKKFKYILK